MPRNPLPWLGLDAFAAAVLTELALRPSRENTAPPRRDRRSTPHGTTRGRP